MSNDQDVKSERLTRAQAKAKTRQSLIEAAAEIFAREGFAGASVERIAEAAGYSIGALYSNFESKEALFLELMVSRYQAMAAEVAEMLQVEAQKQGELASSLDNLLVTVADKDTEFAVLQAEFWLYAIRNPHVMESVALSFLDPFSTIVSLVEAELCKFSLGIDVDAAEVTAIVVALFQGIVRQRRINPAVVPEDLFTKSLNWLFAGIRATNC